MSIQLSQITRTLEHVKHVRWWVVTMWLRLHFPNDRDEGQQFKQRPRTHTHTNTHLGVGKLPDVVIVQGDNDALRAAGRVAKDVDLHVFLQLRRVRDVVERGKPAQVVQRHPREHALYFRVFLCAVL